MFEVKNINSILEKIIKNIEKKNMNKIFLKLEELFIEINCMDLSDEIIKKMINITKNINEPYLNPMIQKINKYLESEMINKKYMNDSHQYIKKTKFK